MRCPYCGHQEDRVIDSRSSKEGQVIRRRRECLQCESRFTTYEQIEELLPMVVKKDGRREMFNRIKIIQGVSRACEKRAVSADAVEEMAASIEKSFMDAGAREISSSAIGEAVMDRLKNLDGIAYVRFASVYRSFADVNELLAEVKNLVEKRTPDPDPGPKRHESA